MSLQVHQDSGYRLAGTTAAPDDAVALDRVALAFLRGEQSREASDRTNDSDVAFKKYKGPPERAAAYDSLLAFDHCLRIMHDDSGLQAFLPKEGEGQEAEDLRHKPILSITSDHGSEQESARWFLLYELGCRGLFLYDARHQLHREFENATNLAGMRSKMKMAQAILSYCRGPYKGAKWFRVLQEEAFDFAKTLALAQDGAGEVLLKAIAPRVAREKGLSAEECSPKALLKMLEEARFLRSYTGSGNFSRWDEFHSAWRSRRDESGLLLLLMQSYCLRAGILKGSSSGVDFAFGVAEAAAAASATAKAEKEGSKTMKEAKAATTALYNRCKNKFHVVCLLLMDLDLMTALNSWHAITFPLSRQLNTLRKEVRGRQGALAMWRSFALGDWISVVSEMHDAIFDADLHRRLGLLTHEDCAGSMFYNKLSEEHPLVSQQDMLFGQLCDMFFCASYQKCLTSMAFFDFPHKLVLLTGNDTSAIQTVCVELEDQAKAFETAQGIRTKWCKSACQTSPMQHRLVKDVLQDIRQNNGSATPMLRTVMTDLWSNLAFTFNEEGFRAMRQHEQGQNLSHAMPSIDGWAKLTGDNILGSFGYQEIEPDDAEVGDLENQCSPLKH
ncbi:mug158 [Symbiodinium sp. CCMP2592]|nr:mug158 [Symbiodinium sp. CCMP2592]